MLNKLTRREKVLLGTFFLTALIYLFVQYVFSPALNQYRQTEKELGQIKQDIGQAEAMAKNKTMEQENLNMAEKDWEKYISKFSTNMQDGLLLVQFSRQMGQEKVLLNKYKPLEIDDRKTLLVLPIELELAGQYPQMVNILDFLENQANLTEIRQLQLAEEQDQQDNNGEISLSEGRVIAKLLLMVYSQPTAQGRLVLEDMRNWNFGKTNPFINKELPQPSGSPEQPVYYQPTAPPANMGQNPNYQWLQQLLPTQPSQNWLPQSQ